MTNEIKSLRVSEKIQSKNLVKIPNIGSENPYDFSENKSNSDTCQILISIESGRIIKEKLEKIIDNYRNLFIQKINLVTEKYNNPKSFNKNVSNAQNNNPIKTAFDNISIIQKELSKSVSDFNDNVRTKSISLEKENISCKVFIKNNDKILPIQESHIKSINPSTGKIVISIENITKTLEVDMSQLCIGTLALPPEDKKENKREEKKEDQEDEGFQETQEGGRKRHTKTKKRVGKRLSAHDEEDLSYCD